jgi:LysR family glycine cleavage system transcriptional activator
MRRRLPPLNALRAFEAAARHLSFTKAAEELGVTQAAVSHQVKGLEQSLAIRLFRRLNRTLVLTDAGRVYLPPLTRALDIMETATRDLQSRDARGPLKVSTLSSFATKWLLPRLPRFRAQHPEIDVLVSARNDPVDFEREDIDIGIRFGPGIYPGLHSELLLRDSKFPVCSPALLNGDRPLAVPADLKHHTLLQDAVLGGMSDIGWPEWLKIAGVDDVDGTRGPGFDDSSMVLGAAIAAQGVALTRASLARDDIAAGLLVKPFGPEVASQYSTYIVCRPDSAEQPKNQAFREWLLSEAAATETLD